MTAAFLAAAVLPIVVFGYVAFQAVSSSVAEHIHDKNSLLAKSLAREVRDFLFRGREILQYTARTMETDGVLQNPSAFLQTIAGQFRFFDSIQVIDADTGAIRYIAPYAADYIGNDASKSAYFQNAVQTGRTFWSNTFISSQSGHPSVTLSVPGDHLIAVGFLNLVRLNDISDRIVFGSTGQAAITDTAGTLIAHRNRTFVEERRNIRNLDIVSNTLAGREGAFTFPFQGEEWVGTSSHIPVPGWSVFVFQTASEARVHVHQIAAAILLGIAGAVILAVLMSLFWVKRLLKPIDRLVESARGITQGNYKIAPHPQSY